MAWTTPRTWVTDEFVSAAMLNTHVRDNFNEVFRAVDRSNSIVDVTNTVSGLSLFDGATHSSLTGWTIPANVMGAARGIRITITGDALYANSDADNGSSGLYVGGTLLILNSSMFSDLGPLGVREGWQIVCTVWNLAANSQIATMSYENASRPGNSRTIVGTTLGAADTTASWKLDVTFAWTTASTNLSFRRRHCVLELI